MRDSVETKRLWRTALIVAGVGLLVLAPLSWLALRMWDDTVRRRVVAANESAALGTLEAIQAAQQLHYETYGQYGSYAQLAEAGILQTDLKGDPPVGRGYAFTLKITPKTDTAPATYSVNADPVRAGDRDATGCRHFFISSEVTGVRYNETRPANAGDRLRPVMRDY